MVNQMPINTGMRQWINIIETVLQEGQFEDVFCDHCNRLMGKTSSGSGPRPSMYHVECADEMASLDEDAELDERAPPGEKAASFVRKRKADFKKRYGKRWKKMLYATAWKLFG